MFTKPKNYLPSKIFQLKSARGFTLIELMVAISIVAVLATIGFTLFQSTQGQARDAKRKQDIDSIATVLEQKFNAATGLYTAAAGTDFTTQTVPVDPLNTGIYVYDFTPDSITGSSTYAVCVGLENPTGNSSDSIGTAQAGGTYYCRRNQQQ